jgi:hypothetical protein
MSHERILELIHAEIDGQLDPVQRVELDRALAADPATRALHGDLQAIAARLESMPQVNPPERVRKHVAEGISASRAQSGNPPRRWLPWRRQGSSNLFPAAAYYSTSGATQPNVRSVPASHTRGRTKMKSNKIIMIGGGLAAAIAAVVYFGSYYPPSSSDVAGTIAPAQRYRAPSVETVQTGDQSIPQLMQTDTFTRLVKDPEFRAMASNPAFIALAQGAAFSDLAKNQQASALFQNAGFRSLVSNNEFKSLVNNSEFKSLVNKGQFQSLVNNAGFQSLVNNAGFRSLVYNGQ